MSEAAEQPTAPDGISLSAEEYAALKEEAARPQELWDRLLRLQAEFDNTRKRILKEQREFERRANERLLVELLGVMDDFERALAAVAPDSDPGHLRAGLEMVSRRMRDLLKAHGVEAIAGVGAPFDPARHDAVAHVETTEHPEATVVEELRKGYTFHGHVIRPATVKVAVRKT